MRKIVSYAGFFALFLSVAFFLLVSPTFARDPGVAGTPDNKDASAVNAYCANSANPGACDSCLAVAISYGAPSQTALSNVDCASKGAPESTSCQSCQASGFIPSLPDSVLSNIYNQRSVFAGVTATGNGTNATVGATGLSNGSSGTAASAPIAALGSDDVANACAKFTDATENASCAACINTGIALSANTAAAFPTVPAQCDSLLTDSAKQAACKACISSGILPRVESDLKTIVTASSSKFDNVNAVVDGGNINLLGSPNCGIPEKGIDGNTSISKCCNSPGNVNEALKERAVNFVPRKACLPDFIGAPIKSVAKVAVGGPLAALLSSKSLVSSFFGSNGGSDGPDFCLTDIPRLLVAKTVDATTFFNIDSEKLPQRACIESAIPVIDGNRLALESEYKNNDPSDPNACKCMYPEDVPGGVLADKISQSFCDKYLPSGSLENKHCRDCEGIYTGLGCVSTNVGGFISSILRIGLGISFGAAFIVMLYAAYLIQTSQGNPEKIKKARDYLNSAIIGLLVVVFATFILQIVGVEILRVPGIETLPSATSN